jgi:hypothetical protein
MNDGCSRLSERQGDIWIEVVSSQRELYRHPEDLEDNHLLQSFRIVYARGAARVSPILIPILVDRKVFKRRPGTGPLCPVQQSMMRGVQTYFTPGETLRWSLSLPYEGDIRQSSHPSTEGILKWV